MVASFAPTTRSVALPDGSRALAGLIWDRAPSLAMPVIGTPGWELGTAKRRATLPAEAVGRGDTSLLLLLASRLAKALEIDHADIQPGIWLLLADVSEPGTPGYWLGTAEFDPEPDGLAFRPVIGPEDVFGEAEAMLQAVRGLASTMALAGIALTRPLTGTDTDLEGRLIAALEAVGRTGDAAIPLRTVEITEPGDATPVFTKQASVSTRGLATAGALLVGLAVAAVVLPGLIAQAQRPAPVPAQPMVRVAPAPGSFAEVCTDTLRGWWPRMVGWQVSSEGCALAGHLPETLLPAHHATGPETARSTDVPVLIWTAFERAGDVNAVLADQAAAHVVAGWPQGKNQSDDEVLLWQWRTVPLAAADDAGDDPVSTDVMVPRLTAIWADSPGAVQPTEAGFSITAPGRADRLFTRLDGLQGLSPVRLRSSRGSVTLDLSAQPTRRVPAALFERAGEEAS